VESTARAQIRLILEHERLAVQRTCQEKLQAMYGEHSAMGRLQSGATAKAGMRIIEELGEAFVKTSVDQVATVAMDTEVSRLFNGGARGAQREHGAVSNLEVPLNAYRLAS
jgi:hypothetical protein